MPLISILIPTLLTRRAQFNRLMAALEPQLTGKVELISILDNRSMKLGEKRNAMMRACRGQYLVHLDDDDLVRPNFIQEVTTAAQSGADVIAYDSAAYLDGAEPFTVRTSLKFENQQAAFGDDGKWIDITRKPWHWCAWRRDVAITAEFGLNNIDEDWSWLGQLVARPGLTELKLDCVLHEYHFNSGSSECQTP